MTKGNFEVSRIQEVDKDCWIMTKRHSDFKLKSIIAKSQEKSCWRTNTGNVSCIDSAR